MRMENRALKKEALRLDRQALIEVYERYSPELYRYAYRLLGDAETAEDCVAETFSRLLHASRNGGGWFENVRAYLYRVAHNWITDYYRQRPPTTLPLDTDQAADPHTDPYHEVSKKMEQEQVRAALLRLPAEQYQVIVLRFLEDWSHEEVAAALGKSVEATRALQYRALNSLQRLLVEQEKQG